MKGFVLRLCLFLVLLDSCMAITKIALVDHNDPDYTDICLEITGEMCDYCCLIDFEWCSRDAYVCEPVRDRNLKAMKECIFALACVILGIPFMGACIYHCVLVRRCVSCYPTVGGISLFECLCRFSILILCCGRRFSSTYQNQERGQN